MPAAADVHLDNLAEVVTVRFQLPLFLLPTVSLCKEVSMYRDGLIFKEWKVMLHHKFLYIKCVIPLKILRHAI